MVLHRGADHAIQAIPPLRFPGVVLQRGSAASSWALGQRTAHATPRDPRRGSAAARRCGPLARLLRDVGRGPEAEKLASEALDLCRVRLHALHFEASGFLLALLRTNMTFHLCAQGTLPADHTETLTALNNFGRSLQVNVVATPPRGHPCIINGESSHRPSSVQDRGALKEALPILREASSIQASFNCIVVSPRLPLFAWQ